MIAAAAERVAWGRPAGGRRLCLAAYTALSWLLAFNLVQAVIWYSRRQQDNDFRLFYAAARLVVEGRSAQLYDRAAQSAAVAAAWPGSLSYPYDNPPPLAWLVVPLTVLPAPVAYWLWSALMAACIVAAAYWISRATGGPFPLLGLAGLSLLPAYIAVSSGQVAPVIVAALALSCWLLRSGREAAAGIAMSVLIIKPHIALLVPVVVALSGRWRFGVTWLVATAALGALSLASLGFQGALAYARMLYTVGGDAYDLRWSLFAQGWAPWEIGLAAAAVALLAVVAARRSRADAGAVVAAGILGSLILNHHLTPSDFVVLFLPAAALATRRSGLYIAAGAGLWVGGWLAVVVPPATLLLEAAALALLAIGEVRREAERRTRWMDVHTPP